MNLTISLNCNSCAGPLVATTLKICKCSYCGNMNKILADGKTVIANDIVAVSKTVNENKVSKSKLGPLGILIFIFIGVVGFGVVMYFIRKKSWVEKQRAII